jgi:hypothetical protein
LDQEYGKKEFNMIQSIQANGTSVGYQANSVIGAGKISTGEEQKALAEEQNEDENTVTSIQGDTLTISNAGAQKAKTYTGESSERASVSGLTEEAWTDSKASAISSAAANAGITEYTELKNENSASAAAVSSDSSSSSSSSSLSEYTDAELKTMLRNGEITQAEYEEEIKRRQEEDGSSDDSDDSASSTSEVGE